MRRVAAIALAVVALAVVALCGIAFAQVGPIGQQVITNPWFVQGPHVFSSAPSPTIVANSCGTGAALDAESTDIFGAVVTGTSATGCTIAFQAAWPQSPFCVVAGESNTPSYARTATQLQITAAIAGVRYTWHCIGRP